MELNEILKQYGGIDKLGSINKNEVLKFKLQKDLYHFIKYFWDTFDGAELKEIWLMEYQAECFMYSVKDFLPDWVKSHWITDDEFHELKLKYDGECPIREKKVNNHDWNMPPRHSKSTTHNVCGPVWLNTIVAKEIASVSHKEALAVDMNTKRQKIINSTKFQEVFGDIEGLEMIKNSAKEISFAHGGKLYSVNMASFTGFGGDIIINDDIVSSEHGKKDKEILENAKSYYRNTLPTRRNQGESSIVWNIQQRIAPGDISGMIEDDEELLSTYSKTIIEAICSRDKVIIYPCTGKIKVLKEGDFLWPERFGDYSNTKSSVGLGTFETQYQQKPINSELTIIKPHMINWITYDEYLANYVNVDGKAIEYASFDFPVKGKEDSDLTGCVLAKKYKAKTAILDAFGERMGYPQQKKYVTNLAKIKPGLIQIYEDKANGSVLVQDIENEVAGIAMYDPLSKSKEQRLDIASVYVDSSNIEFVLDPEGKMPLQLKRLTDDLVKFPFVKNDDRVDAFSQLALYLYTDIEMKVYGKEMDALNIISTNPFKGPVDLCINKVANVWKVNKIMQVYSHDTFVVLDEYKFIGKNSEVKPEILKIAEGCRMIYDTKGREVADLFMSELVVIANKKTAIETIPIVKRGLTKNKILFMAHCEESISSMETFRYNSKSVKDGNPKPATLNDGFAANIRICVAASKGKNGIFY
jgi:hypothetical protein